MSKMPAKKKSCFQITSVTQAQVAASNVADDTESLEDPDESRTEDVSSEIFDLTRTDYETVCDRSSSEENINNVGEQEAPGIMAPSHIPQVGQSSAMSAPSNVGFRKVGVAGSTNISQQAMGTSAVSSLSLVTQSGVGQQQPVPPPASGGATNMSFSTSQQPVVTSSTPSTTTSAASCISRFRVIKLDHGTGEPFRRGRWTCMEFYEKDSEGSVVSRTVDSIRHANAPDPGADRDSGLGFTGGSAAAPAATHSSQGLGSAADPSLPASHTHSAETPQQQQVHHQNYNVVGGMAAPSAFSNNNNNIQPAASQNLLPVGHNGPLQAGIHLQKSPSMPPAGQTPPLPYAPQHALQQLPLGHPLANQSSGVPQSQADYYTPPIMQPMASSSQTLPVASLSGGQPAGQGPSPVMTPAALGASALGQVGEMIGAGGGSLPVSQPAATLLQQTGPGGGSGVLGMGSVLQQQQPMGPYAPSGHPQPLGAQNVPAAAASSAAPAAALSASAAVPNPTSSASPPGGQQQAQALDAGAARSSAGPQGRPPAGLGQAEGGGRKAEGGLAVHPAFVSGKDLMRPLIPESLQLTNPSVNSLFGIAIPMDGDDDRNPSMAFYQAFQSSSRLQDSKAHSDSASGASVVAIDNKIEQAMDLVKSHLMYAVREEVEVLKEQIKELFERNSVLERENAVLKSLANSDQLSQLSVPAATNSSSSPPQQGVAQPQSQLQGPAPTQSQLQLPPQALQLQPQALQLQPQAQQLPPQALQLQPQAQQLPPQALQLPPQAQQLPPQALQLQPQAQQLQPQALQLQPQAQQLPPQALQLQALQLQPQAQQLQPQALQLPPQALQLQPQAQQLQALQLQPQALQLQAQLDASQPPQQSQPNVTSA